MFMLFQGAGDISLPLKNNVAKLIVDVALLTARARIAAPQVSSR
jgi:hypothetical protein